MKDAFGYGVEINDEIGNLAKDFGQSIAEEMFGSMRDQVKTYYDQITSEEIKRLESIKNSLKSVNDQRKKEVELSKAKQAIENAKDEKQLVYRAGVGWTYETDSEAIKKAQENYDQLQTELQQDNIQYQIDQLNTQKEILEAIKDSSKWDEFKAQFD